MGTAPPSPSGPSGPRAAAIDLTIVLLFFLACSAAEPTLDPVLRRGAGLAGVLSLAGYQFACEGLAVVAMLAVRGGHLRQYGYTWRGLSRSLLVALIAASIYDLGMSGHAGALLWIPLRRQPATRMSLASGSAATGLAGLTITIATWGFFESLFGVYFARKLDTALGREGRGWFSAGTLGFAFFNGLIHFAIGQGAYGFLSSFASGYGIAVIPALTGNAWGSALFQTLTDAVGSW